MSDCERHEILVSTWLDGQLEREGQIECLDHLVRCAACRSFYADARALDGLVELVRPTAALERPSPELWARIATAASTTGAGSVRRARVPAWALRTAAGVVVVLGLGLALWNGGFAPPPRGVDVVLGGSNQMTDARFVELTKEVLESDSRYRLAMYRVLDQVARSTGEAAEASTEEAVERPDERGSAESTEADARRIPA
jgi:predicted anti-sigma-YlaC factor YlaD